MQKEGNSGSLVDHTKKVMDMIFGFSSKKTFPGGFSL